MENKKNYNGKIALALLLVGVMFLISINFSSSYKLYCLTDGDALPPNSDSPRYVCEHDLCQICATDNDFPASINSCKNAGPCQSLGGGAELDVTPPILNVNSPVNGEVYPSTSVLFYLNFNEPSSVFYKDNKDPRGTWKRICSNCDSSYSNKIRLSEGENNVSIRIEDRRGNPSEESFVFSIDSKAPKLGKSEPRNGFASGKFSVEFDEANPEELTLHYGNSQTGMRQANVDIGTKCIEDRGKNVCEIEVNLADFDNQNIGYYFEIVDVAGSVDTTSLVELKVDYSKPIINNFEFYFDERANYLKIDFTETNLDEITYIDSKNPRGRENKLCNRADTGICDVKVRLDDGEHEIKVMVFDEAGNSAEETITFRSDLKEPKIKKVEPRKGFASGDFYVEFDEANPVSLVLKYGVQGDIRSYEVNIASLCQIGKRNYECNVDGIDLSDFDGEEISYWFELSDIYNKKDISREYSLEVDTTFPVLNNPNSFWEQGTNRESKYIYFNFEITEQNFEDISYIDYSERSPRWKRLCTRLKEDTCEVKKSFVRGEHEVDVQIMDEAGNAISTEKLIFEVI